jgi:hypothetical protein
MSVGDRPEIDHRSLSFVLVSGLVTCFHGDVAELVAGLAAVFAGWLAPADESLVTGKLPLAGKG